MIARSMRGTAAKEVYAASRTELIYYYIIFLYYIFIK